MKKISNTILTGAAFALLLVGCGQQDEDQRTSDAGSSIIGEDRTSQAPARDPSLPAADPYDERDATGTTGPGSTGMDSAGAGMDSTGAGTPGSDSGVGITERDSAAGTNETDPEARISSNQDSGPERDQSSPDTLTRNEERNEMPLPGQNSDHSNIDPDQTSSR